jgi:hypothetical protein
MVEYKQDRFRNLTLDEALRIIRESGGEYDFISIERDDIYRKRNPLIVKLFDGSFVDGFEEIRLDIGRREAGKIVWPVPKRVKNATLEEFHRLFGEYPSYHQIMSREASALYDRMIKGGIERLRIVLHNDTAARSVKPFLHTFYSGD